MNYTEVDILHVNDKLVTTRLTRLIFLCFPYSAVTSKSAKYEKL